MSHYAAAKAAVVSLTQSLALECASSGIRVNALLPGWIKTDLTEFLRGDEQTEKSVLQRVPMQRWGTAQEIAAVAVFLASDAASFITGQAIVADGGLSVMP
jgi:NAD(P)-dependent dehydrogenase (short-subunit alcohol dehydrogenase family)